MRAFLALMAFLTQAGVSPEQINIPAPDGGTLEAALVRPAGEGRAPAVVALHGCGGPFAARDGSWAVALVKAGHPVLLPDSFGSRGLGSQCRETNRSVTPSGLRRQDAIAAAEWLTHQSWAPSGGVALLGWSNGGTTVLQTARQTPDARAGLFVRFVAFYPGCSETSEIAGYHSAAPMLILIGANDDWTPAAPCRDMAERLRDEITFIAYPGAWHDFDAPDRPMREITGVAFSANGNGIVHAGTDPEARADALIRVPEFLNNGQ